MVVLSFLCVCKLKEWDVVSVRVGHFILWRPSLSQYPKMAPALLSGMVWLLGLSIQSQNQSTAAGGNGGLFLLVPWMAFCFALEIIQSFIVICLQYIRKAVEHVYDGQRP